MKKTGKYQSKKIPFWARCLIIVAIEGIIALVILGTRGVFKGGLAPLDLYRHLTDAFFVPSIFTLNFGILLYMSGEGVFDSLTWLTTTAIKALIPGGRLGKSEKYGDYVKRRNGERKKGGAGIFFLSGGIVLIISTIFLILYKIHE